MTALFGLVNSSLLRWPRVILTHTLHRQTVKKLSGLAITFCLLLWISVFPQTAMAESKNILIVSDAAAQAETLDPQKEFSEKNHIACQQIFDGLIRFGPNCDFEPALATSWERLDPLRMRFHLRPNVKFHNGETFDAEAVKFTLERYLDPKTGFPAIGYLASIDHAEIIDPHTIDIVTKYPDGLLLNRIAGFILISPPKYIKEKGEEFFATHPIGTGAFILDKWDKDKQIVFSANKNYWMNGYPKLDGLVFMFIPPNERIKALFSGKIQLVTNLPGTQTRAVTEHPNTKIMKKPAFRTLSAYFNSSSKILKDVRIRKALNYATNKKDLIRYDLMGNGAEIAALSIPGEYGHNSDLRPYEFDTDKARKLLKDAGYPEGFELKVLAKESTARAVKIITTQLANIGIKTDTVLVPDAKVIPEFKKHAYDMAIADPPDPMCHSYFIQSVTLFSKSPYSLGTDPVYDEKLIDMASTIDEPLQEQKAKALDKYVYDNALSIFTYQQWDVMALNKKLVFEPYLTGMPYFFAAYFKNSQPRKLNHGKN